MRPIPGLLAVAGVSAVVAIIVTSGSLFFNEAAFPSGDEAAQVVTTSTANTIPCVGGTTASCPVARNTNIACPAGTVCLRNTYWQVDSRTQTRTRMEAAYCGCNRVAQVNATPPPPPRLSPRGTACGIARWVNQPAPPHWACGNPGNSMMSFDGTVTCNGLCACANCNAAPPPARAPGCVCR